MNSLPRPQISLHSEIAVLKAPRIGEIADWEIIVNLLRQNSSPAE